MLEEVQRRFKVGRPDLTPPGSTWLATLWDAKLKLLRSAYGSFRPHTWAARFPFGKGLAGHAFRFSATAVWQEEIGDHSVIYWPEPDHRRAGQPQGTDYSVIVSVPIRFPGAPALGVMSVGLPRFGPDGARGWAQRLTIAVDRCCREVGEAVTNKDLLELAGAVNVGFWEAVLKTTEDNFETHRARAFAALEQMVARSHGDGG